MMSAKAGKRPLRSLTAHEKLEAIRRVHDGESKASVARDIGVPESTLRGWCKNEEKISYISRQSSPETDDSIHASYESKEKKPKLDDSTSPFNLSLKSNPPLVYSPNHSEDKPLNLNVKTPETPKLSERERNRAELQRLSIELGLNRPEMYPTNALADLSSNIGILNQWNNILLQQQAKTKKITAPADTSSNIITSSTSTPILPPYKPTDTLPKVDPPKSVEDSVWYWLKTQQAMLGLAQNQTTSTSSSVAPNAVDQNSSWFWKWYKQYTQASQQLQQQPDKQILYQQLTKDKDHNPNIENLTNPEKPKGTTRARAVLDNLLLNNNNNVAAAPNKKEAKEDELTQSEALEHGEKFLKWLECCSEPSVTAMQIMQFRGLINNIKTGADRKNGDVQKTKVRRK